MNCFISHLVPVVPSSQTSLNLSQARFCFDAGNRWLSSGDEWSWYYRHIVGFFGCEILPLLNLFYDRFLYIYPNIYVKELVFSTDTSVKLHVIPAAIWTWHLSKISHNFYTPLKPVRLIRNYIVGFKISHLLELKALNLIATGEGMLTFRNLASYI